MNGRVIRPEPDAGPTISVLLPTYNDGPLLARQLAAVLPQLRPVDELVLLDDGSNDGTEIFVGAMRDLRVLRSRNRKPSGVCSAYNQCARIATKEWCVGASGNDVMHAGALRMFRRAVTRFPQARVAFGKVEPMYRLGWSNYHRHFAPAELPELWRKFGGWHTHGAGAFVRRDVWRHGYPHEAEWMADWLQTLLLACEFGALYVHGLISTIQTGGRSYSAAHADDQRFNRAVRGMRKWVSRAEFDPIRPLLDTYEAQTRYLDLRFPDGPGRP